MIKLLPHQKKEGAYLASRPGTTGNFGGMGSGKTLTALEGINRLDTSAERMIIVIVGPPVSLQMWHDEYEATVGGPAQIVLKGKTPLDPNTNCYIFSYDIAYKRAEELRTLGGRVFIMDESHACKSPDAKRTHALVGSGGACEGFDYTWWLSGTPSTRYNDDVFTFLCRAAPERLKEKIGKLDLERFRKFPQYEVE